MLHGQALLRGVLAASNCGIGNVMRAVQHGLDLDFYTVGRDYAREVLDPAGFFAAHGWDGAGIRRHLQGVQKEV